MSPEESARKFAELATDSNFIAVLSGAGSSTNAGIPDFRGPEGIYTTGQYDAEKVVLFAGEDLDEFFRAAAKYKQLEVKNE